MSGCPNVLTVDLESSVDGQEWLFTAGISDIA